MILTDRLVRCAAPLSGIAHTKAAWLVVAVSVWEQSLAYLDSPPSRPEVDALRAAVAHGLVSIAFAGLGEAIASRCRTRLTYCEAS